MPAKAGTQAGSGILAGLGSRFPGNDDGYSGDFFTRFRGNDGINDFTQVRT